MIHNFSCSSLDTINDSYHLLTLLTIHNLSNWHTATALREHGAPQHGASDRHLIIARECSCGHKAAQLSLQITDRASVTFTLGAATAAGKTGRTWLATQLAI